MKDNRELEEQIANILRPILASWRRTDFDKPTRYPLDEATEQLLVLVEQAVLRGRIVEVSKMLHKDVCEVMCGWSKICDKKTSCVPIRKRLKQLEKQLGEEKR